MPLSLFHSVRTYPGGEYLATLDDDDTRKIVCLSCARLQSGTMVVVTGGWELKVWELLTSGSRYAVGRWQLVLRLVDTRQSDDKREQITNLYLRGWQNKNRLCFFRI